MMLGLLYERRKMPEEAIRVYEEALRRKSDFFPVANNLAWLLLTQGRDLDRTLELANIAARKAPGVPAVLDTLGWAYFKKEKYGLAATHLRKALSRTPKDPFVMYHLGMAYARDEKRDQALPLLRKAYKVLRKRPEGETIRWTLVSLGDQLP